MEHTIPIPITIFTSYVVNDESTHDFTTIGARFLSTRNFSSTITTLNDVNVDDIKTPGGYYLGTGITGANEYSYLIVFKVSYNLTQICYSNRINILRIRNYHNSEWTNWVSITLQS